MTVAVVVRDEELGLPVVAIHDLGSGVTEPQETLPERVDVDRRPVESNALVSSGAIGEPARRLSQKDSRSLWTMQPTRRPSCRIARSIDSPSPSTQKRRLFSRSALGMTGMQELASIAPLSTLT